MTVVKLNIPFKSQWDADAKDHYADCGPTCLSMILNAMGDTQTPDQLYSYIGQRGASEYTSFGDLRRAAESRKLKMTRVNFPPNTALNELRATINSGRPFVALVNYAFWDAIVQNRFRGSHFVLVTGYDDDHVYIHDPLFQGKRREEGNYYKWTNQQFTDAWGGFAPGVNPNFAVLIAETQIPFVQDSTPATATPAASAKTVGSVTLDDGLRRRLRAKAAYDKQPDPNLDDPAVVQKLVATLGDFGVTWDSHTVRRGDNITKMANMYYQDPELWRVITAFNDIAHPSLMEVGEMYLVPRATMKPSDDATVPLVGFGGPTG